MARVLLSRRRAGYRQRVTSKEVRIGFPGTLASWIAPGLGHVNLVSAVHGQWLRLRGGDLPVPVMVRIDETDDGRFVVTGLLIADADRTEITWSTLRGIRPATLMAEVFRGFDPLRPRMITEDGDPDVASVLWSRSRPGGRPRDRTSPTSATRARVATDLEEFADAYSRNRARAPHRAMTDTADQLHISRATAIRRAQQCRDAGLLPPKGA